MQIKNDWYSIREWRKSQGSSNRKKIGIALSDEATPKEEVITEAQSEFLVGASRSVRGRSHLLLRE